MDRPSGKIISRNEETFVDKIYKFFDKFLHFWPSSSVNEVDKKSVGEKSSKNEVEKRIDDKDTDEENDSGLGNYSNETG